MSMLYPSIGKLLENMDSRYTLVIATAKRARQISEGQDRFVPGSSDKAVTIAIDEIAQGKVAVVPNDLGNDSV